MDPFVLKTSESPVITLESIGGDLRLSGWDQNQFHAESTDAHTLRAEERNGGIVAQAAADCVLHVPRRATIKIAGVGGDAKVKNIAGQIDIVQVGGDLILRQVGGVRVGRVGGDLSAKKVDGPLAAQTVSGDFSARGVAGNVTARTMADLYLRDVTGSVSATSTGDAVLSMGFAAGQTYEVQSSGDVVLRVPPDVSAKFTLQSAGDVSVDLPGARIEGNSRQKTVTVGEGAAQVAVRASGDVSLTTVSADPEAMGDFGDHLGREFGVMAEELAAQIESQIESQMAQLEQQLNEQLSHLDLRVGSKVDAERIAARARAAAERAAEVARRKSEAARRRAEAKIEAARHRAERLAERAERGRRKAGGFVLRFDSARPAQPSTPPAPPVSDEERLAVLKMLEQGKITVEQAEKLLAALEGEQK